MRQNVFAAGVLPPNPLGEFMSQLDLGRNREVGMERARKRKGKEGEGKGEWGTEIRGSLSHWLLGDRRPCILVSS